MQFLDGLERAGQDQDGRAVRHKPCRQPGRRRKIERKRKTWEEVGRGFSEVCRCRSEIAGRIQIGERGEGGGRTICHSFVKA